ncbi:MAG: hypothetical protein WBK24_08810 [Dethiobacteria bacterium]|nr:hypothetical protein [Bacillota bacterium]HOJ83456.1 hypothetical protein [Bacillota bacterium]HOL14886.1 hypothetical protein [Bacillota bacterium]
MQVKKEKASSAPRGVFMVFRLPLLILLMLGLLCGLGFGGWQCHHALRRAVPAEEIRQNMQENIAALVSYHARFKTMPAGGKSEIAYSVEIWKEIPHRYRLEMITYEAGRQVDVEVVVGDHDRVYLYDQERGEFLPAGGLAEAEMAALALEDYWRSISEAPCFNYLNEESGSRHHYYQVEVIPSEPHRYRVSERVWLEKSSLIPVRIESYDVSGRLTQVTVFELLQLNPALEENLFHVDSDGYSGSSLP